MATASTKAKTRRTTTTTTRDRALALAGLLLASACSRKTEGAADAGTTASSVASASSSTAWPSSDPAAPSSDAGAPALVAAHFGPNVGASDVLTESVDLTSPGRTASLVRLAGFSQASDAKPFLFIADDDGKHVLWSRERPIAGITPPVGAVRLAPAPSDRVALAACDPPTNIVALRIFDDDGAPFADLSAMSNEACEGLSLTYWPKRGWLIVITRAGATRAQLVKENGGNAWPGGIDLGVKPRSGGAAAPSVVVDTNDTFLLAQIADPNGEDIAARHALVFRYDAEGAPIWPKAVDIPLTRAEPGGATASMRKIATGVMLTTPEGRSFLLKPSGAFEAMK